MPLRTSRAICSCLLAWLIGCTGAARTSGGRSEAGQGAARGQPNASARTAAASVDHARTMAAHESEARDPRCRAPEKSPEVQARYFTGAGKMLPCRLGNDVRGAWAMHPTERLCCAYDDACSAPLDWNLFESRAACTEILDRIACVPGSVAIRGCKKTRCPQTGRWPEIGDPNVHGLNFVLLVDFGPSESRPNAEVMAQLDAGIRQLLDYVFKKVTITGFVHATEASSETKAHAFALKRAEFVRDRLIAGGVDPNAIVVSSGGFYPQGRLESDPEVVASITESCM
jgi:outer membrane protein OmpA-like peptidoglycan-associated protein